MANIEEFEKKTTFKNLTNLETKIVNYASKLGRGIELNDNEKRKYYNLIKKEKKMLRNIEEKGWMEDWKKVGLG